MATAGVAKWCFEGEGKANATRYKLTLSQEHKLTYLAENKHQSPKLLDTNRRRQVLAVAFALDVVAATFRWAPWPWTLPSSLPSAFYPEHTSIQKTRNPLKPNEKTFSNRHRTTVFRNPQLSSVKLTQLASPQFTTARFTAVRSTRTQLTTAALGRAGLQSRRNDRSAQGALAPETTILIRYERVCALATSGREFLMRDEL